MNQLKLLTIYVSLLLLGANALARGKNEGGEGRRGTRGGAQYVPGPDGKLTLLDIVDPTSCENKSGIEIRQENSGIDWALSQVALLDWYLAAAIKHEINDLIFCFTTDLKPVPTRDRDSIIIPSKITKYQTAVRILGTRDVYVDKKKYEQATPKTQALTIIHEALHGFIPFDAPQRDANLRDANYTIKKVTTGEIASAKIFHRDLERFYVDFPWTAHKLVDKRKTIEFALSSLKDKKQLILKTSDLNLLFQKIEPHYMRLLDLPERYELSLDPVVRVANILEETGSEDLRVLYKMLNKNVQFGDVDILMVALSTSHAFESIDYQNHVLNSDAMLSGPRFFKVLESKSLRSSDNRILGTYGFSLLGISDETPSGEAQLIPALSVHPYTVSDKNNIHVEIQGLLQFLSLQANRGEVGWEVIRQIVSQSEAFYRAFGIEELNSQLQNIEAPIAREKTALAEALPELVNGLRAVLIDHMTTFSGKLAAAKMDNEINWTRLGLPKLERGLK